MPANFEANASGAHAAGGAAWGASWRDEAAAFDAFKTAGGEGPQVLETDCVSAAVTPGSFDPICPSRFSPDGGPYFYMARERQPENTTTTRDTSFRQQARPDTRSLEYPYSFIGEEQYDFKLTPKAMIGEPREQRIDFPSCVTHYHWIHAGMNDEDAWRALFQYKDENERTRYGFYAGECGYTGFDCTGCMELYVSDRYDVLIMKALSDYDYSLYMRSTQCDRTGHLVRTALCIHAHRSRQPPPPLPPYMQLQFSPLQLRRFLRSCVLSTAHAFVTPPATVFHLVHAMTKSRWIERIFVRVMSGLVARAEVRRQKARFACASVRVVWP